MDIYNRLNKKTLIIILGVLSVVSGSAILLFMVVFPRSSSQFTSGGISGTIYYVDSTAGDDNNSGTSQTAAWRSLDKVQAKSASTTPFAAGDQILLKKGQQLSLTKTITLSGSGSLNFPIKLGAYGSGEMPIIAVDSVSAGFTDGEVMLDFKDNYWTLEGIKITGSSKQLLTGVRLTGDNNTVTTADISQVAQAVIISGDSGTVISTRISSIATSAKLTTASGVVLIGNNASVVNNRFSNIPANVFGPPASGIAISASVADSEISRNFFSSTNTALELQLNLTGQKITTTSFHHNVVLNSENLLKVTKPSASVTGQLTFSDFNLDNNTVVKSANTASGQPFSFTANSDPTGIKVRNNIFYYPSLAKWDDSKLYQRRNNLYYFLNFNQGPGSASYPLSSGEISGKNPQFVDMAKENFALQVTSPAIDKGLTLPYTRDYADRPVPQNGNIDIGAHEFQVGNTSGAGLIITQSGGNTKVSEGSAPDTFSVRLRLAPVEDVIVDVTPDSELTVEPAKLTFTKSNWSQDQTVKVSAIDDSAIEGAHTGTIKFGIRSQDTNYANVVGEDLLVSISDNETSNNLVVITHSGGSTVVTEGGNSDDFSIVLAGIPANNVTITFASMGELSFNPASVTFTPSNWNTARTITVSAIDDSDTEGTQTVNATMSSVSVDPNFNDLAITPVSITIIDNEAASVEITQSGGSTAVSEAGVTDSLSVKLLAQPTANVIVYITPNGELSRSPSSLTFTSANWSTAQTVTISALDDAQIEGTHTGIVSFATSSSDSRYNGLTIASITVIITDNDSSSTPGASVNQTGGTTQVVEGGATDSFSVVLSTQPVSNVVITINVDSQISVAPTTLTFTPSNWASAQTVTVSAVNDALVEGTHSGSISFSVSSSDADYNGLAISGISVTVADND